MKRTYASKSDSPGLRLISLDRNPKVLHYDNEGTDEGAFIVALVLGYAFDDAAEKPGDDPEARMACHYCSFGTVKEALERIKNVEPCFCGRCLGTY